MIGGLRDIIMGEDGLVVRRKGQKGCSRLFCFYNWGANNKIVLYLWILGKSKRIGLQVTDLQMNLSIQLLEYFSTFPVAGHRISLARRPDARDNIYTRSDPIDFPDKLIIIKLPSTHRCRWGLVLKGGLDTGAWCQWIWINISKFIVPSLKEVPSLREFYKGTERPEAGRTGHIYQGEPGSDLHFNDLYNQQLAQESDGSLDSTNGTLGLLVDCSTFCTRWTNIHPVLTQVREFFLSLGSF